MLDIDIDKEILEQVCTPGSNDLAVAYWTKELGISKLHTKKEFMEMVKEWGCHTSEELKSFSKQSLAEKAFWNECWNQFERLDKCFHCGENIITGENGTEAFCTDCLIKLSDYEAKYKGQDENI